MDGTRIQIIVTVNASGAAAGAQHVIDAISRAGEAAGETVEELGRRVRAGADAGEAGLRQMGAGSVAAGELVREALASAVPLLTLLGVKIGTTSERTEDLSDNTRKLVNGLRDAGDMTRELASVADLFGSEWGDALNKIADGLNTMSAAIANMASGNPVNQIIGVLQAIQAAGSIWSGLFGRDGLFGSGQFDDAHAAGWMGSLGVNDTYILAQIERRIEELRNAGLDKFRARTVAEMESIKPIIDFLGKINQSQADQMLWKISHAVEALCYGTDAWRASYESILAVLDQVDRKNIGFTQHMAELTSGLARHGLLTEEVFEKIRDYASDDHLRAWMTETAAGVREGSISLGEFTRQLSLLFDEALSRGIDVEGQMRDMLSAATAAGWSLEDVTSALTAQKDLYADHVQELTDKILELRDKLREIPKELAKIRSQMMDVARNQVVWQMVTLPGAKQQLQEQFTAKEDAISFGGQGGAGGYQAFMEMFNRMNAGGTEKLTAQELQQLLASAGDQASREAILAYIDTFEQKFQFQEQMDQLKEQVRLLKEQKEELKRQREDARADRAEYQKKLTAVQNGIDYVSQHWGELTSNQAHANGLLAGILDQVTLIPKMATGGYVPDGGLYVLHPDEYVLSSRMLAAMRGGAMVSMNAPGDGAAPVAAALSAGGRVSVDVRVSVDPANNRIMVTPVVDGQAGPAAAIDFEYVDGQLAPMLRERALLRGDGQ